MRFLAALLATVALVGVASTTRADPPAPKTDLTAQEREFFAWWDGLGFPDVTKLPFVKVQTGDWSQYGDDEPKQHVEAAFLVSERGSTFTVFRTDLQTAVY